MARQIVPFGTARDGRPVEKILLRRGALEAEVMTLGAAVLSLKVPSPAGAPVDVVLGWSSPAAYEENGGYLGMLVGRYANRIAITNDRVKAVAAGSVTFIAKDYRNGSSLKEVTLSCREFIRRFMMHVLPPGFQKIRYYGFLSNRYRKVRLAVIFRI